MSVGAIHFDIIGDAALSNGSAATRPGTEFDFAAMLSLASALGNNADIDGPAAKTEAFRTSALGNHLRTTTITFTDGTSETRVETVGQDFAQAPLPLFAPTPAGQRITITEPSDLEPELGLNMRTEPDERWRNAMGKRAAAFRTGQMPDARSEPSPSGQAVERDDEGRIGKLIDALV